LARTLSRSLREKTRAGDVVPGLVDETTIAEMIATGLPLRIGQRLALGTAITSVD
jgi:hypothetical protein